MKVEILFAFVLSIQLVLGTDTCALTCKYVQEQTAQLAKCEGYNFQVTPNKGTFEASRQACFDMGGDLIQQNIGPDGAPYHEKNRQLAIKYANTDRTWDGMWIGYTDRASEGTWRYLNGKSYDGHNHGQEAVAYWNRGEPNNINGNQHCGKLFYDVKLGALLLDDERCDATNNHGLCEIKTNKCSL